MNCIQCGKRTRIVDSRPSRLGTRRRHECANGHRKTTYEVSASFLFRLARDVLAEPGFFNRATEYGMESAFHKFVDTYTLKEKKERKLRLVKAG